MFPAWNDKERAHFEAIVKRWELSDMPTQEPRPALIDPPARHGAALLAGGIAVAAFALLMTWLSI